MYQSTVKTSGLLFFDQRFFFNYDIYSKRFYVNFFSNLTESVQKSREK